MIDIGGGSTELVVGEHGEVDFHVSTQAGVVRHTERHIHSDPPQAAELEALAADARSMIDAAAPAAVRERAAAAVAVAGTATACAAIDLELDPYDPARVEGHRLHAGTAGRSCGAGWPRCRSPSAARWPACTRIGHPRSWPGR